MVWKDARLSASACKVALHKAAFAFVAETELERDALDVAELRLERPEALEPMLPTESLNMGTLKPDDANSLDTTHLTISPLSSLTLYYPRVTYRFYSV